MAPGASRAVGERSVSVGGDVVGSLIVTGDDNNVNLVLGAEHGALLEQLARRQIPTKRLRDSPVRSAPSAFADSLDREDEVRKILDELASRTPVNVVGPPGIGKTYAILRALNTEDPALRNGAVYLYAPGPLDDVLQLMFEAWYECEPPFKPSNPQLRRDLAVVHGLVALDSVDLERDAGQQVLLAAAGCRVLMSSRERVLSEGTAIALHGLPREDAVVVLERELGRTLEKSERDDADRVCAALEGHPLKIREAVAAARDADRTLADLANTLTTSDPDAVLAQDKLRASGEDGRKLLAALALFGDATVGKDHLRAVADVDDFEELLMSALRRRDVRSHSPRYNLGATLSTARPELDLTGFGVRALAHFTAWAQENRARTSVLMSEASALVALLRWAINSGRFPEAIKLGRSVDHAFALERRFGAWEQVLDLVHAAALAAGDRESEAWALHQLGTRAICVGDLAAGGASLAQAAELRRGLGDARGAKYSARNAAMATRPRGLWTWIAGHSVLLGVALAVIVAGAVAAATVPSSQPSQSPPAGGASTPVRSSTPSNPRSNTGTSGPPGQGTATTDILELDLSGKGSVAIDPGHGTCPPTCQLTLPRGTKLSLAETPADGLHFSGWGGGCSGLTSPCALTMTQDWLVAATFSESVTLSINTHMTVTSDSGGIDCLGGTCSTDFPVGTTVTLTTGSPAYWLGAPDCAQPQGEAALKSEAGPSTTSEIPPTSTAPPTATAPPATTATTPAALGSTSCSITLDRSYEVTVVAVSG